MYNVFNYLFGWDYVAWKIGCVQGVSRVFTLPDGKVYYRYVWFNEVTPTSRVIWLTCKPEKYFKKDDTAAVLCGCYNGIALEDIKRGSFVIIKNGNVENWKSEKDDNINNSI